MKEKGKITAWSNEEKIINWGNNICSCYTERLTNTGRNILSPHLWSHLIPVKILIKWLYEKLTTTVIFLLRQLFMPRGLCNNKHARWTRVYFLFLNALLLLGLFKKAIYRLPSRCDSRFSWFNKPTCAFPHIQGDQQRIPPPLQALYPPDT